jgi:tripartite-type tricarboxylate transporter receptor subunit TctC
MRLKPLLLSAVIVIALPGLSRADDFYRGKTIRVIVGGSAGGGFDIYTRAMARHMGKHIPGNPALVVENMTGAGTLIAAKYLHSSAKPDGLTFGMFNGALILGRVLGMKGVRKLEFLGVPVQDSTVCALREESGAQRVCQDSGRSGIRGAGQKGQPRHQSAHR